MMFSTTHLLSFLHLALLTSAQGFTFTGPPTSSPLDLSAPIHITWTAQTDAPYSLLDLTFTGPVTNNGGIFGYDIADNLTVSAGNFTWDPEEVSAALQQGHHTLVTGSAYSFKANLHNEKSSSGEGTQSGTYQVTGYPSIGAAAGRGRGVGGLMMLGLMLASVAAVLR